MCLVPEYQALTNRHAKEMFQHLQVMQQRFLIHSQTYVIKEILLAAHDKEHKTDLQSILMSIPDPTMPDEKLFHSVNNMLMMTLFFVFALTATMHVPLWTNYQKWWGK